MTEQLTVESNEETPPQHVKEAKERARERATEMWKSLSSALSKPAIGASVAGATVLAAGALWGVTEAAFAGIAAWAVFRALRRRAERDTTTHQPADVSG